MNPATVTRFARQLALPAVGPAGQERLGSARAAIVGDGLAAETVARYLAAAGVGVLRLIGGPAAGAWDAALRGSNPDVVLEHAARPADGRAWMAALEGVALVVRADLGDDAMLPAAIRRGVPAIVLRGGDTSADVVSFRRHGPCPHAPLDVPAVAPVPFPDGAASVVAGTLAACASPQSVARLDTARADFKEKVRPARMMIQYDRAKPGGLTPTERERREAAADKAFSPACAKPYAENLHASVDAAAERAKASGALAPLETLPETARLLDLEFDKCVAKFGVVGFNFFKLEDGRELRAPEYLSETIASLRTWGDARATVANEQQDNTALVVASVAGAGRRRRRKRKRQFRSNICRAVPPAGRHGGSRPLAHKSKRDLSRQHSRVSLKMRKMPLARRRRKTE